MRRTLDSTLSFACALGLALATLLTGAWDLSGHGHDPVAANAAYCAVDHETEAAPAGTRATVGEAASLHEHSCVACKLGRSQTMAERKQSTGRSLDRLTAAVGPRNVDGPRSGEARQQTARGPPLS